MSDETATVPSQEKGIVDEVWDWLGSIKFVVVVLVLLAIASALGTMLAKDIGAKTPLQFAKALESLEQEWGTPRARLYMYTHAYDVWHALWYRTLLALLLLSSIVCTTNRFKATLRRFRRPRVTVDRRAYRSLRGSVERTVRTPRSACADTIARRVAAIRFAVFREDSKAATDIFARSGGLSLWGSTLVHASLTVCMVAALWGTSPSLGAWRQQLQVPEDGWGYLPQADLFVRCDEFGLRHTEVAEGFYEVGDYASRLSFFKPADQAVAEAEVLVTRSPDTGAILTVAPVSPQTQGKPPPGAELLSLRKVGGGTTRVNHPVRAGGADVFQASRGIKSARLRVTNPSGEETVLPVLLRADMEGMGSHYSPLPVSIPFGPEPSPHGGSPADVPDSVLVRDFATDFRDGKPGDSGTGTAPHPGLEFLLIKGGPATGKPAMAPLGWTEEGGSIERDGWKVTFEKTLYWTGLDVRQQPGLWLLMTGFVVAGIGLVLAFWIPLHEVRIKVEDSGTGCTVRVGVCAGAAGADAARLVQRVTDCLPRDEGGGARKEKRR
jgi:cytochrome c biogenesis protein ResB